MEGLQRFCGFCSISARLGIWAIPTYVAVHTLTLALYLPHAVFFEAGASMLFGFLPALLCVFSAIKFSPLPTPTGSEYFASSSMNQTVQTVTEKLNKIEKKW